MDNSIELENENIYKEYKKSKIRIIILFIISIINFILSYKTFLFSIETIKCSKLDQGFAIGIIILFPILLILFLLIYVIIATVFIIIIKEIKKDKISIRINKKDSFIKLIIYIISVTLFAISTYISFNAGINIKSEIVTPFMIIPTTFSLGIVSIFILLYMYIDLIKNKKIISIIFTSILLVILIFLGINYSNKNLISNLVYSYEVSK